MSAISRLAAATCVAALSITTSALAEGPSLETLMKRDFLPPAMAAEQARILGQLSELDEEGTSKGAFAPFFQWPAAYSGKLRVCFFGGSEAVRQTIKELASEWERPENGVRFDWGKKGFRNCETAAKKRLMHIRVSFNQPGYFSALGGSSIQQRNVEEASMNFEGFDKLTPDEIRTRNSGYDGGTVRHEFGHALGLTHEHQSPKASCEADFDWDFIYKEFGAPPNNWDKGTIDFNMRRETDPDIVSTKFDPQSVMKYYYDAKLFKNGDKSTCFVDGYNNDISPLDYKAMAFMYPAAPGEAAARTEANKAALQALVDKADEKGASKGVGDLVGRFFPEPEADGGEED